MEQKSSMSQQDFNNKMESALSNDKIADLYVNLFRKSMEQTVRDINTRIDFIEDKDLVRDEKIEYLEWKVDEIEQEKRSSNIIITGLESKQANKNDVRSFLNEKLHCKIGSDDINYVLKLGRNDTANQQSTNNT